MQTSRRPLAFAAHQMSTGAFLAVVTVCIVSLIAFIYVTAAIQLGHLSSIDKRLLLSLRTPSNLSDPLGPIWFQEMMRDFTALGSTGVLVFITVGGTGLLFAQGRAASGLYLLIVAGSGRALNILLKYWMARPRPDLVPHMVVESSTSFPSSHSMMSATIYLTIAIIVASGTGVRPFAKIYALSIAAFLTSIVGASRVYLGVHWPSDVLAGWAIGAFWATLCWILHTRFWRSRAVSARGID